MYNSISIYNSLSKGYLQKMSTNKKNTLSQAEVEILSVLKFRTEKQEGTTKNQLSERLGFSIRHLSRNLSNLKKLGLVSCGDFNQWIATDKIYSFAGFNLKNGKLKTYRFWTLKADSPSASEVNANRLYWLLVSLSKEKGYVTYRQTGLAAVLQLSRVTIGKLLKKLVQQRLISYQGSSYTILEPDDFSFWRKPLIKKLELKDFPVSEIEVELQQQPKPKPKPRQQSWIESLDFSGFSEIEVRELQFWLDPNRDWIIEKAQDWLSLLKQAPDRLGVLLKINGSPACLPTEIKLKKLFSQTEKLISC